MFTLGGKKRDTILTCVFMVTTDGNLLEIAARLNTLLASENERLRQLTDDLKQKHSHMTSEVREHVCELEFFLFLLFFTHETREIFLSV